MAGLNNNLYPPIIDTYMPAFVRTQACKIYFSLSIYNSYEDIKNAQVIISNQNTNMSVLKQSLYPAGIKIANINIDNSTTRDDRYYITISPSDLEGGVFELNQFYKVQIRFTGINASNITDSQKIASWLNDNESFFSEWSTVCLIKGIQQPIIYIKGFEDASNNEQVVFTTQAVDFVGSMYYEANSNIEKEFLKSYRIKLYKTINMETPITDSDVIYTNQYNPNEINYSFKYGLEDGEEYTATLEFVTNNLYTETKTYNFAVMQYGIDKLNATISADVDAEEGRIKIDIISKDTEKFTGNLTIRRTSSESNFSMWEDVHTVTLTTGTPLEYTWYDTTVQSGVWYRYCAQKRNSRGDRGVIIQIDNPIMVVLDDSFLTRDNIQLKIKYDPQISSFKHTIAESRTETIGSKYPFIRRNGNLNYKQFPISGLITHFCDDKELFTNKDEIYGETKSLFDKYNSDNNISEYRDYIYEREFRNKVIDFLYDNTVKLFRSTTEGNILVKLMDINLTPNQTLGRMLYSFSATAYEVDEPSIENYNKYGIQLNGDYSSYIQYSYDKLGQLQGTFSGSQQNLVSLINDKYSLASNEGFKNVIDYLKWIRIEFESEPYLIRDLGNGEIAPLTKNGGVTPDENTAVGYIMYLNNEPIIVSGRGYYELRDEGTRVYSIWFPVATKITIDYVGLLNEIEDTSGLASRMYYYHKVGQCWGTFNVQDSVSRQIYLKYLLDYDAYYQELVSINGVNIEAEPGTVVYVKDSFDTDLNRHVIGETGALTLNDEDTAIEGLYFCGVHLNESKDPDRDEIRPNEFVETGIKADDFSDIENPIPNGVYWIASFAITSPREFDEENDLLYVEKEDVELVADKIYALLLERIFEENKNRYIYYNNEWYIFTNTNDVLCSVQGLVDYYCEVVKGEY